MVPSVPALPYVNYTHTIPLDKHLACIHTDMRTVNPKELADMLVRCRAIRCRTDKFGNLWTGAMSSDLIMRFNPRTSEFRFYLLPRLGVNVRRGRGGQFRRSTGLLGGGESSGRNRQS